MNVLVMNIRSMRVNVRTFFVGMFVKMHTNYRGIMTMSMVQIIM